MNSNLSCRFTGVNLRIPKRDNRTVSHSKQECQHCHFDERTQPAATIGVQSQCRGNTDYSATTDKCSHLNQHRQAPTSPLELRFAVLCAMLVSQFNVLTVCSFACACHLLLCVYICVCVRVLCLSAVSLVSPAHE